MVGQPLNDAEWGVLIEIAEDAQGLWPSVECGRLLMRGFAVVGEAGKVEITERGMEALGERANSLVGCLEGSAEELELARIVELLPEG
jgi:hypothetical protein